jgi:L,D-transpeptidase-like protein
MLCAASTAFAEPAQRPQAPAGLDPAILALAERAADAAIARLPVAKRELLTVIDYSLPSTERRLWVLDRVSGTVLWHELVAHGSGTGENLATAFSNRDGSRQSSLGLFLTEETYQGRNGLSLRMRGLEPGVNDLARQRAIVMHGAPYVSEEFVRAHGRLGRSWGCPALPLDVSAQVIDRVRGGSLVFAYYPDRDWLRHSQFLEAGEMTADAGSSSAPAVAGARLP